MDHDTESYCSWHCSCKILLGKRPYSNYQFVDPVPGEGKKRSIHEIERSPKLSQQDNSAGNKFNRRFLPSPGKTTRRLGSISINPIDSNGDILQESIEIDSSIEIETAETSPTREINIHETEENQSTEETEEKSDPTLTPSSSSTGGNSSLRCRSRHKCNNCGKMFGQLSSLKWHEKEHLLESAKHMECVECGKGYTTLASYQRHLKTHPKCLLCGKSISKLEKESQFDEGGLVVNVCKKCRTNDSPGTLTKKKIVENSEEKFVCDVCTEPFTFLADLELHYNMHSEPRYDCRYCRETFLNAKAAEQHEVLEHGSTQIECSFCPSSFKTVQQRLKHELVHQGEKDFICELCGQAFRQRFRLEAHLENDHPQDNIQ